MRFLLIQIIDIYMIIVIIRAVLSWFPINRNGSMFRIYLFLIQITEPVLSRVREFLSRMIPNMAIDFSPFIVIILLNILRNFIARA